MGQTVKLRRSAVAGKKPINSQLELGELSLNTTDGKLFFAKSGSQGPTVEEIITTNAQNTGSLEIIGSITGSNFTGSFVGDASGLYNIPVSGVTGLSLDKIENGLGTASIDSDGLQVNVRTSITGSLTATEFTGSGLGLTNVPVNISGSSDLGTIYNRQYTKFHFDEASGIKVEGDSTTGVAKIYLSGVAAEGSQTEGRTTLLEVTSASSTWTLTHNLGERYPAITVFDSDGNVIIPQNIEAVTANQLIVSFASPQTGTVSATVGGGLPTISGSYGGRVLTVNSDGTRAEWKEGILSSSISFNTYTSSIDGVISSIENTTSSFDGRLDLLELESGSIRTIFNSYTASNTLVNSRQDDRLNAIEIFTGSIDNTYATDADVTALRGTLNSYTSSNNVTNSTQNGRLSSLETESGSIRGTFNSYTSSNNSTNNTQNSRLSSLETKSGSLEGRVGSLETISSSHDGRLDSLETTSGSHNSRINTLESFKTSVDGGLEFTGSNVTIKGNLLVKGTETRVNSTTVDLSDNIISLNGSAASNGGIEVRDNTSPGLLSGSLLWDGTNNYWVGGTKGNEERLLLDSDLTLLDGRLDSIESKTGSFLTSANLSTLEGKVSSLEVESGSIRSTLNSYTTSNDNVNSTQNGRLSSLETESGSIRSTFNTYTSSNNNTNTTQNSRLTLLETSTGSLNLFTGSINTTIKSKINSDNIHSGSYLGTSTTSNLPEGSNLYYTDNRVKGKLNSERVISGSIQVDITSTTNYNLVDGRLDSIESFTASLDNTYATDADVTGLRNDLNSYTSSTDNRIDSIESKTGSFLTTETQTLQDVTDLGSTTSNSITAAGLNTTTTISVSGTNVVDSNRRIYGSGTASNTTPAFTFAGDTDTGLSRIGTDSVGLIAGASRKFYVSGTNAFFQNLTGGLQLSDVPLTVNSDATITGSTLAGSFRKIGGVSTEFLKADGSVDTNTYLTSHPVVSAATSSNNSGRTYIQDILLDQFGHITGITTGTETVVDTNNYTTGVTFNTADGVLTFTRNNGDTFTVDIDGKYSELGHNHDDRYYTESESDSRFVNSAGDTMTGDLVLRNDTAGDNTIIRDITWNSTAAEGTDDRLALIRVYTSAGSSTTRGGQMNFYTRQANSANFNTMVFDNSGNLYVPTNVYSNSQQLATQAWVTGQNYLTAHPSVSAASSSNNSGRTYIQDILLDSFGHITGITTATETVVNTDTNYYTTGTTWNGTTATLTFTRNDGGTYNVQMLETLSDVTVTGGTYNSGTQTLRLTKSDGSTVDVSGFAVDTDVNWYTTGATFNSSDGVITGTRNDGGTWTVDIDGRYLTAHPSVSAATSSNNSGRTYIQDILLDSFGHITGITTATETVVNTDTITRVGTSGNEVTGTITLQGSGAATVSQVAGVITVSAVNTTYSAGAGIDLNGTVFSHADTSAASSSNNSGRTYIQDILLDTYGHITGITTATETVVNTDTNYYTTGATFNTGDGVITFTRNNGGTYTVDIDGRYLNDTGGKVTGTVYIEDGDLIMDSSSVNGTGNRKIRFTEDVDSSAGYQGGYIYYNADNNYFDIGTHEASDYNAANDIYHIRMTRGTGNVIVSGTLTAGSFIKSGGTSSQFLKADGSVDSSTYLTAHPSVSAASSSNNSGRTYIQDILLDSFGHITGITTATETVVNSDTITRVGTSGNEVTGTVTLAGSGATSVNQVGNTITISSTNTTYTAGGGLTLSGTQFSHADTSATSSSNNSGRTYIQDILLDTYGHITGITTATETVVNTDTNYYTTGATWTAGTATLTFTRNDGGTYNVQMLETLTDVTVTGGTYNSGTQTLRLTKSDGSTVDVSGFAVDTDVNWYTTGATFNTSNGVITGTRNDGGTWTVDIDGKYLDATSAAIHNQLYVTGGDANTYTRFGIYRNYAVNGPIAGHNTILNVAQYDGNYGFQLGADTTSTADGLYYRSKDTTTGTWKQVASRSWVTSQNYLTQHPTISAASSSNNSGRTYIQDILLDTYGHITGITTATETVVNTDTNYYTTGATFNTGDGVVTFTRNNGGTYTVDLDGRYLQSESDTLASVTARGATTSQNITINGQLTLNNGVSNGSGQALIVGGSGDVTLSDGGSLFFGAYDYGGSTYIRGYDNGNYLYFYLNGTNSAYLRSDGLTVNGTIWTNSHGNSSQWNTAYGWGNHASAGYLTAHPTINGVSSNNSGRTYIQDVLTDANGHVTGLTTATETVVNTDTNYYASSFSWNTGSGVLTLNRSGLSAITVDLDGRYAYYAHQTTTNSDFNNVRESGIYTLDYGGQANANSPDGLAWHALWHARSGGTRQAQITIPYSQDNIYFRRAHNSTAETWYDWVKIWHESNDGAGSGLDADVLDGQQGTYYLDYNNFSNTPTIGNGTITVSAGGGLSGSGSFTVNQTGATSITISHADTSAQGSVNNSGRTYIQDILLDTYGHITGITSATETVVNTDTNYYTTGTTFNSSTGILTFTRNDGGTYTANLLSTLSDVTVTGGTYNSGNQTLTLTKSDGNTVSVSGFAIDTDVNYYTTGATFNTGNGVITGTLNNGSTWTVDIDGRYLTSVTNISGYAGALYREDNRTISPSELTAGQLKFGFVSWDNNNGTPYADFLHMRSYTDASGGSDNLVMFKKSGIGMRIWQQSWGSSTAYSSYVDVWTSGDFTSTNVSNWNTAYGWGNHAGLYAAASHTHSEYLKYNPDGDGIAISYDDSNPTVNGTAIGGGHWFGADGSTSNGYLAAKILHAEGSTSSIGGYFTGAMNISAGGNSTQVIDGSGNWVGNAIGDSKISSSGNWNTAYGWGNHASAGYIVKGSTIAHSASWSTATKFESGGDISQAAGNHALQIYAATNNDAFMAFHISGDYAVHFGLDDSTNRLHVGGWSDGTGTKYQMWDSRDFTSTNISNWNTAYGWGNHASAGYQTSSGSVAFASEAQLINFPDGPRNLSDRNPNWNNRSVSWDFVTATTVGGAGNYAGVMTFSPWDGTTSSTGDSSYQLAFYNITGVNASGIPGMRLRNGIDTTWKTWYTVWHSGNDGSGSGLDADTVDGIQGSSIITTSNIASQSVSYANSAGNADTVDSLHATSFMRTDAQSTTSGHLIIESNWSNGSTYSDQLTIKGTYPSMTFRSTNADSNVGGTWLIHMDASGDLQWYSSTDGPTENWTKRMSLFQNGTLQLNSNTVWHTGNDGSGSGLDADLLDGQQGSYYTNAANLTGTIGDVFTPGTRYNIGLIDGNGSQTRDKIRVWDSSEYTIGMKSGYTYGWLGKGTDGYAMSFQMSNTQGRGFWWGDTGHNDSQGAMSLTTDGKATIATSLTVGEGESITAPSSTTLYVKGNTQYATVFDVQGTQGQLFSITDDLTGDIFKVSDISGIPILNVNSNGTVTIDETLNVYGDVTAYYSSDERLKDNVIPITNAIDKMKLIGGYEFDWNENSKHEGHDVGVIAQEIEKVLPEVVTTRSNGYKAVKYEKLTALLIQANKELIQKVEELERKLK